MPLAEPWCNNPTLLSLENHSNPVSLLEQEACYRRSRSHTPLEQFLLTSLVETNIRVKNDHNIRHSFRLHLVNDQPSMLRRSLPVDTFRIISRHIVPHTVELGPWTKRSRGDRPRPRAEVTRPQFGRPYWL